jgi:hypothetical protein
MKELGKLKQLRVLDLRVPKVTDTGLSDLAGLENIQMLLAPHAMTDRGLKEVGKFKQLETLDITYSRVTDAGMKELAGLAKLNWLDLRDTAVTDVGIVELAALKQLRWVNVDASGRVTEKGIRKLEKAVPGLHVQMIDPR